MIMNDVNSAVYDDTLAEKSKQILIKVMKSVLDFKNVIRIFELVLLLVFNLVYGRKPLFTW